MHNLEAQLHTLLEDIAPNAHNLDEQAKIIALASSILTQKNGARRLAKVDSRVLEAKMTDAILVAMSSISSEDYEDENYFDARGLTASQLIKRVANSSKPSWGQMDILDPDAIEETFTFDEEEKDFSKTDLENAEQTTEAFDTPGRGRHRSDFISAPIR